MKTARVLIFGDSIAYGAWDNAGGWVDRLKRDAHGQTIISDGENKTQVINLGVGGDTSTGVLARLESEIKARYSASWPFVFIFAIGTNDERSKNDLVETNIEQFDKNIRQVIDIAKKYTNKIIFAGLPPLGGEIVNFKDQEYSDERIIQYETVLKKAVEENELTFIPLREAFSASEENVFSYDSLHPNDTGHEIIYNEVKKILSTIL